MDILYGLAFSLHLGLNGDYNDVHPQIRIEHDRFIAGAYYNSEFALSPYAGVKYDYGDIFVEGGIVGGYSALGSIIPFARAGYNLSDNSAVFITPGVEDNNVGVVVGIEITRSVHSK